MTVYRVCCNDTNALFGEKSFALGSNIRIENNIYSLNRREAPKDVCQMDAYRRTATQSIPAVVYTSTFSLDQNKDSFS
uniref:Uncharacterized protein n=1 Tax=Romanomermis culicivorax TaxID=13658 RepID=A0A915LD95_ROMCU